MEWLRRNRKALMISGILLSAVVVCAVLVYLRSGKVEVYAVSDLIQDYYGEDGESFEGEVVEGGTQTITRKEGEILSVNVSEGDVVQKGDLLLTYDTTSYRLALESSSANIALMESQIQQTKEDLEKYQKQLREGMVTTSSDSDQVPAVFQNYQSVLSVNPWRDRVIPVVSAAVVKETIVLSDLIEAETKPDSKGADGQWQYYASLKTTVTGAFLKRLQEEQVVAEFIMCQNGTAIGRWIVDGSLLAEHFGENWMPDDWMLGDGIKYDENGNLTVDFHTDHYGVFSTMIPRMESEIDSQPEVEAVDVPQQEPDEEIVDEYLPDDPKEESFPDWSDEWESDTEDSGNDSEEAFDDETDLESDQESEIVEDEVFSRTELEGKIKEKQKEITSLQRQLRIAQLEYRKDELSVDSGEIRAESPGRISYVGDLQSVKAGSAIIRLQQDTDCRIRFYVDEFQREDLSLGDELKVSNDEMELGMTVITTDIHDEPDADYQGGYNGLSWYPVFCTIKESEDEIMPAVGTKCRLKPINAFDNEAALYIDSAFVRKDGGGRYVMKVDEKELLEKVYVDSKIIDSYTILITAGLSDDDRIAFPYGNRIREGAKVKEGKSQW